MSMFVSILLLSLSCMNSNNNAPETKAENVYVTELKSLLKDKFFMLLLGISVAIVLLSTIYSFIRPKTDEQMTASVSDQAVMTEDMKDEANRPTQPMEAPLSPTLALNMDEGIAGLETTREPAPSQADTSSSFFGRLKATADTILGRKEEPDVVEEPPVESEEADSDATESNRAVRVGETYTIQEGDTLWDLAERAYNSGYNFMDIASSNNIINPDYILVGQEITFPSVQPKEATAGDINGDAVMTRTSESIATTYTVSGGDSLWNIADDQYNDPYQWVKIAELNPSVTNPDFIMPGQVLKLK